MILYQNEHIYDPYQHHTHSHRILATITGCCTSPTHSSEYLPQQPQSLPFIALSVNKAWRRLTAAAVKTQFANIIYKVYQHLRTVLSTPL